MGQTEILEFLEKNPKDWYCAKDILVELGYEYNINTITKSLKKLLKLKDIKFKEKAKYKTNKKTKYYQVV